MSRSPSPTEKHNEPSITAIKNLFIAVQYNKRADAYQRRYPQIMQIDSRLVVSAFGFDGDELVALDDVGREVVAVDAAGVDTDSFAAPTRLG